MTEIGTPSTGRLDTLLRVGWGLGDQVVSSLSNLALGLAVARSADARLFGVFSVGYFVYLLLLGVGRSLVGDPVLIEYSERSRNPKAEFAARVGGLSLLIGLVGSAVLTPLAVIAARDSMVVAFGAAMPLLLLQDSVRYLFLARGEAARSFGIDLVWLVLFLGGWVAVAQGGRPNATELVWVWGSCGAASAIGGLVLLRCVPRVSQVRTWFGDHWNVIRGLLTEFVVTTGAVRMTLIWMPAIIGVAGFGGFRLADLTLGPVNVLFVGTMAVGVSEIRRRGGTAQNTKAAGLISALVIGATVLYGGLVLMVPDGVMEALVGEGWKDARPVVALVIAERLVSAGTIGPLVILRSRRDTMASARARSVGALSGVLLTIGGGFLGGVRGMAAGYVIASSIALALLWRRTVNPSWAFRKQSKGKSQSDVPRA